MSARDSDERQRQPNDRTGDVVILSRNHTNLE